MSEKDARYCLRLLRDEMPDAIDKALADDPDVVGLLRWAYEQLGYAGGGGEEAALGALIERLEKQVDLSDEPPGWEWVEEDNGTQKGCRHDNE